MSKCYFAPYSISSPSFPEETGPFFVDYTKTKLVIVISSCDAIPSPPCENAVELHTSTCSGNKIIRWYECPDTMGRTYSVVPTPCYVSVSNFDNSFQEINSSDKYGVEEYQYENGICIFSIDGHNFTVQGQEGDCGQFDCDPNVIQTFSESTPSPISELPTPIPEAEEQQGQQTQQELFPTTPPPTWPNVPDTQENIGTSCFDELEISPLSDNYSHDNASIAYLPSGHVAVVYEERNDQEEVKLKVGVFKTSVNSKIQFYRSLGYGALINNENVSTQHTGTFVINDDFYIPVDASNIPTLTTKIGFLTGPLEGNLLTISTATREIQTNGLPRWILRFDLGQIVINFPDTNSIYNIQYFVMIGDDQTLPGQYSIGTILDIPPHTFNGNIVPVSNPSITVASNNLAVDGAQSFYIAYQAFEEEKWKIYLQHIILNDGAKENPTYLPPYTFGPPHTKKSLLGTNEIFTYEVIHREIVGDQLCAVFKVNTQVFEGSSAFTVTVPANACCQFAGQSPSNNGHIFSDVVGDNLPTEVSVVGYGSSVTLNCTGGETSHCTACIWMDPDGYITRDAQGHLYVPPHDPEIVDTYGEYEAYGVGRVRTGYMSLVGVFLDDRTPIPPTPPINQTPYGPNNINYAPQLRETFFVGKGPKTFTIPNGATRLFLGTADIFNWTDNVGSYTVEIFKPSMAAPLKTCTEHEGTTNICGYEADNNYAFVSAKRDTTPTCELFGPQWAIGSTYPGLVPPTPNELILPGEDYSCITEIITYPDPSDWCIETFECQQYKLIDDVICPPEYLSIVYKADDLWVIPDDNPDEYGSYVTRVLYNLGSFSYFPGGIIPGTGGQNTQLREFWVSSDFDSPGSPDGNDTSVYTFTSSSLERHLKVSNFNSRPYMVWADSSLWQFNAKFNNGTNVYDVYVYKSLLSESGVLTDINGNTLPTPMSLVNVIPLAENELLAGAAADKNGEIWWCVTGYSVGSSAILRKINPENGTTLAEIYTDLLTEGLIGGPTPYTRARGLAIVRRTDNTDRFILIREEVVCIHLNQYTQECDVWGLAAHQAYEIDINTGLKTLLYVFPESDWRLILQLFTTEGIAYDGSGWVGDIDHNIIYWHGTEIRSTGQQLWEARDAIYALNLNGPDLIEVFSQSMGNPYQVTTNIAIRPASSTSQGGVQPTVIPAEIDSFRIVERDVGGYDPTFIADARMILSYRGDLSELWTYHKSDFAFVDEIPMTTGSTKGLSKMPFELVDKKVYGIDPVHIDGDIDNWVYFGKPGPIVYQYPNYGHPESSITNPIYLANGRRPRICTNNRNNIFVVYENDESGITQLKIVGTGDFAQSSITGPKARRITKLIKSNQFQWTHVITTESVNQLCDMVVDKSDVVHIAWQTNRDNNWEIYYANALTGFDPVRVTQSESKSLFPSLAVSDKGDVFIVYHDDRFGKQQILMSVRHDNRILPLLQQDPYLASLRSGYSHYVNRLPIVAHNPINNTRPAQLGLYCTKTIDLGDANNRIFWVDDQTGNASSFDMDPLGSWNVDFLASSGSGIFYGIGHQTGNDNWYLLKLTGPTTSLTVDTTETGITNDAIGKIDLNMSNEKILGMAVDQVDRIWVLIADIATPTRIQLINFSSIDASIVYQEVIFNDVVDQTGAIGISREGVFYVAANVSGTMQLFSSPYPIIFPSGVSFQFTAIGNMSFIPHAFAVNNINQLYGVENVNLLPDKLYLIDTSTASSTYIADISAVLGDSGSPIETVAGFSFRFSGSFIPIGDGEFFSVGIEFYTNKEMAGSPVIIVDSRSSPEAFINLDESPYFGALGVFLEVGESKTVYFSSILVEPNNTVSRPLPFESNRAYFPKISLRDSNGNIVIDQLNQSLSFSCSKCNPTIHNSTNAQGCYYSFIVRNNYDEDMYYNFQVDFYSDMDKHFLLRRYELAYGNTDIQYAKVDDVEASKFWLPQGLLIPKGEGRFIQVYPLTDSSFDPSCGIKQYVQVNECASPSAACHNYTEVQSNRWTTSIVPVVLSSSSYSFMAIKQIGSSLGVLWQDALNDSAIYSEYNKPNWISSKIENNVIWADLEDFSGVAQMAFIKSKDGSITLWFNQEFVGSITGNPNLPYKCVLLNWLGNPCIFVKNQGEHVTFYYRTGTTWNSKSLSSYSSLYLRAKMINGSPACVYLYSIGSQLYYRYSVLNSNMEFDSYDLLLNTDSVNEADIAYINQPVMAFSKYGTELIYSVLENGVWNSQTAFTKSSHYPIEKLSLAEINNRPAITFSSGILGSTFKDIYYARYDGTRWVQEIVDTDITSIRNSDIYPQICKFNLEAAIGVINTPVKTYFTDVDFESTSYVQPIFYCECASSIFAPSNLLPLNNIARWTSSASGTGDIRVTDTTHDSYRPVVKSTLLNSVIIIWESMNDAGSTGQESKLLGALFERSTDPLISSGSKRLFDYDFGIFGKDTTLDVDIYGRVAMAYERLISGIDNQVFYKVCDLKSLPQDIDVRKCDISRLVSNIITSDPLISADIIKKIKIREQDIEYYTYNAAKKLVPVVSKCLVMLEIFGSPEIVALRFKNESDLSFSDWCPWNPEISDYHTEQQWKLSPVSGIKEVCLQAMTYNGITTQFCLPIIADYIPVTYETRLYSDSDYAVRLSTYKNIPIATIDKTGTYNSKTIYIEIIASIDLGVDSINYDVLQQGYNDLYDLKATRFTTNSYRGSFTVYKQDFGANLDGLAQIRPKFQVACEPNFNEATGNYQKDVYNQIIDTAAIRRELEANLDKYRQNITGRIGVPVVIRDTDQDPFFIFGDPNYSVKIQEPTQPPGPQDFIPPFGENLPVPPAPGEQFIPAPLGLKASDGDFPDKIDLTWNVVSGATAYDVYRSITPDPNTAAMIVEVTETQYSDTTNLEVGVTYYYWARTRIDTQFSKFSLPDSGYLKDGRPNAPSGLQASDRNPTDYVYITWNIAEGATSYVVYRSLTDDSSTATEIGTTQDLNFKDFSAELSVLYWYWVKAQNEFGKGNFSNEDRGYRGPSPAPPPPATISATDGLYISKIVVSWDEVANASSYKLYRGLSSNSKVFIASVANTTYNDFDAAYGQIWWYGVTAVGSNGFESDQTCCDSGYKASNQVTGLTATTDLADRVRLDWHTVPEASSYHIWKKIGDGDFNFLVETSSLFYEDFSVLPETDYFYYVKAFINTVYGTASEVVNGYILSIPPPPDGITASTDICNYITVVVGDVTTSKFWDLTEKRVYRNTSDTFSGATVMPALVNGGNDTQIDFGVTYYYWATSVGTAGESSPTVSSAGISSNQLDIPTANASDECGSILVSWDAITGAEYYTVSYGSDGTGSTQAVYGTSWSWTGTGRMGFKVRSENSSYSCHSDYSPVVYGFGETLPGTPNLQQPQCPTYYVVTLFWIWTDHNPTNWIIEQSDNEAGPWNPYDTVPGNFRSKTYEVGIGGTNKWWRVTAVNSCGSGPPSNAVRDTCDHP